MKSRTNKILAVFSHTQMTENSFLSSEEKKIIVYAYFSLWLLSHISTLLAIFPKLKWTSTMVQKNPSIEILTSHVLLNLDARPAQGIFYVRIDLRIQMLYIWILLHNSVKRLKKFVLIIFAAITVFDIPTS